MDSQNPTFAELLNEISDLTVQDPSEYPNPNWNPSRNQLCSGRWIKQNAPETLAHWAKQVEKIADNWEHPSPAQVIHQAARIAARAAQIARVNREDQIQAIKAAGQDAKQAATELQERSDSGRRWDPNGPFLLDAEQHARLNRAWHIIDFFRQAETQTMAELYAPFIGSVKSLDQQSGGIQPNPEDQAIMDLIYAEHAGYNLKPEAQPELP